MSHHHEGCCVAKVAAMKAAAKVRSQNRHCGHGHQHEHGQCRWSPRSRRRSSAAFGHGDELRLVILDILSRDDSHGYELIHKSD